MRADALTGAVPRTISRRKIGATIFLGVWKFEIHKDDDGGWRWRLVARNTVIVAESSESYDRRGDAKQAAEVARTEINHAPIVVL